MPKPNLRTTPRSAAAHPAHLGQPRLVAPTTWALLAGAWLVAGLFIAFGSTWLAAPLGPGVAAGAFGLLFATILAASFGVVHEADHLAQQLGEPYGTLVLTLSIVSIEVILIASVLLGPGDSSAIGRDSIFAVMMIIMNLVIGICLVAGSARHGDQEYNAQGATAYLGMIVLLTGTALVLPNHLGGAGAFSIPQALGMAALTACLYAAFLWLQMRSHRRYFIQPAAGSMAVPASAQPLGSRKTQAATGPAGRRAMVVRSMVLLALVLPIVLLAHYLAIVTDYGIAAAGAPAAVGGVLIAIIVFTPESITAVRAAMGNEMQRAINLCLGAFVSTVGLTVPAVLLIGVATGQRMAMGLSGTEVVLLVLTVALAMLSFNGQRTSPIQGLMHLTLFAVFGLVLFLP
ncbi:calcium:proton antiporter [Acidovorax sp. Root217]|uniref:calcium:proton antiporter n=1 Tax=Acidovorax sp. Root217 TaxID=1736492 RepID=UPI000AA8D04B